VLLVLLFVEAGIVVAFDPGLDTLAGRLTLQAALAITLVGVALVAVRPGSWEALGMRDWVRPPWGWAALAYMVYIAIAAILAVLIHPHQEDVTRELGFGESGIAGDVAAGLLIVVVAPFSEELFFRGFMFAGLRNRLPLVAAALISAAVWGLFHFTGGGSWGVVVQLTVFGVILAWLYEYTGSIWPAMAVHVLNNAIAFAFVTL
jgi:membrane protease YdiL (CAAX protease family)